MKKDIRLDKLYGAMDAIKEMLDINLIGKADYNFYKTLIKHLIDKIEQR